MPGTPVLEQIRKSRRELNPDYRKSRRRSQGDFTSHRTTQSARRARGLTSTRAPIQKKRFPTTHREIVKDL
jgi:hypothetical protein